MHSYRSVVFLALSCTLSMSGQSRLAPDAHAALQATTSVAGNGSVEVRLGNTHERVTALRDDVVRITIWRGNTAPEDASWAVPALVRHGSVPITEYPENHHPRPERRDRATGRPTHPF